MIGYLYGAVGNLALALYDRYLRQTRLTENFWRACYNRAYTFIEVEYDDVPFTNFGYEIMASRKVAVDDILLQKQASLREVMPKKFHRQWKSVDLYGAVLGQAEVHGFTLTGKSLLEIGCGRGGGCMVAHGMAKPERYIGVDLSEAGVKRCRALLGQFEESHFPHANISFMVGNCLELEKIVAAGSIDVVVNVESSHCYPHLDMFFDQVHIVLKAGGLFLWADLQGPNHRKGIRYSVQQAGFQILGEEDISSNVTEALKNGSLDPLEEMYRTKINDRALLERLFCRFVWCLCGRAAPSKLIDGDFTYTMLCCKKVVGDDLEKLRKDIGKRDTYMSNKDVA